MATESSESPPLPDPEYDRKFNSRTTALEVIKDVDLSAKTILITGTTQGIGIETARALAIRGAHIVMANRSIVRAEAVRDAIYKETEHRKIDLIHMDLTSLQSVQAAANKFLSKNWPLHVLILNAGAFGIEPAVTIDNFNSTFQTNHLGHFYLVHLLRAKLIDSAPSRVVVVASNSHKHTMIRPSVPLDVKIEKVIPPPTTGLPAYLQYAMSKLCNVLFAFKLHRDLEAKGVSVYVLHPGSMIPTAIGRTYGVLNKVGALLLKPFTKTLEQGAATTVYCAASPIVEKGSGRYYENCYDDEKSLQKNLARDEAFQEELWKKSMEYIEAFEKSRQQ